MFEVSRRTSLLVKNIIFFRRLPVRKKGSGGWSAELEKLGETWWKAWLSPDLIIKLFRAWLWSPLIILLLVLFLSSSTMSTPLSLMTPVDNFAIKSPRSPNTSCVWCQWSQTKFLFGCASCQASLENVRKAFAPNVCSSVVSTWILSSDSCRTAVANRDREGGRIFHVDTWLMTTTGRQAWVSWGKVKE